MTTLSSEFLAQSTMPLRPFMGKLMSVITDTAGSLWMLATAETRRNRHKKIVVIKKIHWKMLVDSLKILLKVNL